MKIASNALLLAAVAKANQNVDLSKDDATHLVEGLLLGALHAEFSHVGDCITDGEVILKDVENAVKDFKSNNVHDITEGLKAVGHAMMEAKKALKDCKGVVGDWKKLEDMAAAFTNPTSFAVHIGKDLVVHGHDIYKEVKAAIKAYESTPKDYKNFGYNIGEAASQIILGSDGELAVMNARKYEVAQILSGMLQAFGGSFNLEALLFCIYDEDQALLMLDVAVQAFESAWEKQDISDVIGGIIGLVGFVQQFKQGLPICEAIDTKSFDFNRFYDTIDIAANPFKHMAIINNDIKMHGKSIMQDLRDAVAAYKVGAYEQFGVIVGNVLEISTQEDVKKPAPFNLKQYAKKNWMIGQTVQGFMKATGLGDHPIEQILLCIYQVDQDLIGVYEGAQIAESGFEKKDWVQLAEGAIVVYQAINILETKSIPYCENNVQVFFNLDQTKINDMGQMLRDTKSLEVFGDNLIFNDVTVTSEIIQAMQAYEKEDYNNFGFFIGQAFYSAQTNKEHNMYLY